MSLDNQTTLGDYAPHPQRRRVSRGRKALIGLMAIGAFAAVGGAGTFASFTASTDNPGGTTGANNPFRTPDFELTNTVLARSGTGTIVNDSECKSSNEGEEFPTGDALFGVKNASYCEVLFAFNDFATTATADLLLENTGANDGDLVFYAATVDHLGNTADQAGDDDLSCVIDMTLFNADATHTALCDGGWSLQIQEYAFDDATDDDGDPLTGSNVPVFGANTLTGDCVLPSGTNVPAAANCSGFTEFDALPLFRNGNAVTIGSLPMGTSADDDPGDAGVNDDRRYFRVTAELTKDTCTDADDNGFDDETGIGCYNEKMNGSAVIQLRWVLQG